MTEPAHIPETQFSPDAKQIDMRVHLRGTETAGALSLFEEVTPPNAGPPVHVHHSADEFFRVLAGDFRFKAGDQVIDATAGATLFVPRGMPHCFCNVGETQGRLFMGFTPGGPETFFDWIAQNGMPDGTVEQAEMIRREFATEFLGPNPFAR